MAKTRSLAGNSALLDIIRNQYGIEQLRNEFHNQYWKNPDSAIGMLNDDRLKFPTLFLLQPEIAKLDLDTKLTLRNRTALDISREFISDHKSGAFRYHYAYRTVLQWMFKTGYKEAGLGDEYDAVMDFTAILLVREIHDKSCLPMLEEMIFERHRKGSYTYDAEWALFESKDPDCISLVAKRLLSNDRRDVELAKKMLAFIPCFDFNNNEPAKLYNCVLGWLNQNRPYLRYTGENNQKGTVPCPYEVSLEAKYYQMPYSGPGDINQLPYADLMRLKRFDELDMKTKVMLSNFSDLLQKSSTQQWQKWMSGSLQSQIETANSILGEGAIR